MSRSVLWANDFPPTTSGIATFFVNIWRNLPPEKVLVIAPRVPESKKVDQSLPFTVWRLNLPTGESGLSKGLKTLFTVFYCFAISLVQRPERHHCGQVFSSGIAGWLCRKCLRIPYVVYVYGSETVRLGSGGLSERLMRRVLNDCEVVVANSQYTAQEFISFGISPEHIKVIYPGVDPDYFVPADPNPELLDRYGLAGKRALLTVARLDERKGHDVVIRALGILSHEFPDLVYLIPSRGREEPRLRSLTRELNLDERIQFLGFVPDEELPNLYNLCDIYVMPNRVTRETVLAGDVEGFGIAFIEASSCAKPVVAGRSGGAVEAVADGETGILVDAPDSPEAVAEALRKLLSDPDLCQRLGKAGRVRVTEKYDWRLLARQVAEIL